MRSALIFICFNLVLGIAYAHPTFENSGWEVDHITNKKTIKRKLLITGCARTGTHYTTHLLNKCGLRLGHENLEKDGTVAWQGVFDVNYYQHGWHYPDAHIKFKYIFHQIRNPLDVITSLYNRSFPVLNPAWTKAWDYIEACVPEINPTDPLVVKCAKYWYYWNLAAEKRADWTYRIEDIDYVLPEICERLALEYNQEALDTIPKDVNHFEYKSGFVATWKILKTELSPKMLQKIKTMAERYDYPTHD